VTEPARWGLRRSVLDLFEKVGLGRPAIRSYELALAARGAVRSHGRRTDGGLPVPPATLRAQVGPSHADLKTFLTSGRRHSELVRDVLRDDGTLIEDLEAILDWGCGCGRVLRHWSSLPQTRVCGCDIDARMVEWCEEHLPFAEVAVTALAPPLPYEDETFDLVYAFSVFTHLSEELQHAWMAECFRILRPGRYLLISTLGEYYLSLSRLNDSERRTFDAGNVVVLYEGSAGSSMCSAYHPPRYVHENLAAEFELVTFRPAADDGRHDIHLFRKPVSGAARRATAR
jgi:SAM-dependent methyltransferase